MPESSNANFAEFAAQALGAFRRDVQQHDSTGRSSVASEEELVSDLLADLMHYCHLTGLDFENNLSVARDTYTREQADEGNYVLGSAVRLVGTAAHQAQQADLPLTGTVTGLITPQSGQTEYSVRCPGDTRNHRFTAKELGAAPPFSAVATYRGTVGDPLDAERAVIAATARIGAADEHEVPARQEDIEDHHALLGALADWCAMPEERLNTLLLPKYSAATRQLTAALPPGPNPAQLAAQNFPHEPQLVMSRTNDAEAAPKATSFTAPRAPSRR